MDEKEKTTPPHLYHYYKVEDKHTEAIFTKDEIFFQSPIKYNDLFDSKIIHIIEGSQVQIESWLRKQQRKYPNQISKTFINAMIKDYHLRQKFIDKYNSDWECGRTDNNEAGIPLGVFCSSEKQDNILMWAHYSDSHKGFCLQFSTNNVFFGKSNPITYQKQLPKHNMISSLIDPDKYLVKAVDWEYEKEWRVFQLAGPGAYLFPPEALTGVIFGCRMESKNKEKIINWCRQRNPRPQLYNAVPKATEYGLDIVPFDYPA
jgi:hypothetical protein